MSKATVQSPAVLAQETGAAKVGFVQPLVGAVKRFVSAKVADLVHIKDFGPVGQGSAAIDTAAVQAAINCSARRIDFGDTDLVLLINATINATGASNKELMGRATLKAADGTNFESVMDASGTDGLKVGAITFDANEAGRSGTLTTRTLGINLSNATNYRLFGTAAANVTGYGGVPGVGISLGGVGGDGSLYDVEVRDCGGTLGAADGVYCSHDSTVIFGGRALRVGDTGFVFESCNDSGMIGGYADEANAAFAITNATGTDKINCFVRGFEARNWNSAVTGGVQIGNPLASSTGNLVDVELSGIRLYADTGVGKGTGPALNIRKTGSAETIGLKITGLKIVGATAQGILGEVTGLDMTGVNVSSVVDACIQLTNSTGDIKGCVCDGGSYGLYADGASSLRSLGNTYLNQTAYGIYAAGTSSVTSTVDNIQAPGVGRTGKAAGATVVSFGHIDGYLAMSPAVGGTTGGAIIGKDAVYDQAGNLRGYYPLYDTY